MSELASNAVKTGYWINWSQGQVLGATITVTARASNIIVALLAVLVALACTHLWNISIFFFHQSRAKHKTADGLFRQQQVLLRTVPTPASTIVDFIKLAYVWRRNARNVYMRCLVPCLVAVIFKVASVAAGLFVSYAVTSDNPEVLVRAPASCYPISYFGYGDDAVTLGEVNAILTKNGEYAERCYDFDKTPSSCEVFVKPYIKTQKSMSACPFDSSICALEGDSAAITLDSGFLDSNGVFGINAPEKERIKYRRSVTCAPLKVAPYLEIANMSDYDYLLSRPIQPNEKVILFHYGSIGPLNFTLGRSQVGIELSRFYDATSVSINGYPRGANGVHFRPELDRTDADVTINYVFTGGVYSFFPIDDPVFAAHRKVETICTTCDPDDPNYKQTTYGSDEPAGVVACATQYQYCIPSANGQLDCGEPGGMDMRNLRVNYPLQASITQVETMTMFTNVSAIVDISVALTGDRPILKINDRVQAGGVGGHTPVDQWQTEVEVWDAYVWANTQQLVADHAIGFPVSAEAPVNRTISSEAKTLCRNQKMIKPGGFANVSVFGLAFTIAMSCIIVVLDMALLKVLIFVHKFGSVFSSRPRMEQWIQDGVLQLQRRAYQATEEGNWSKLDNEFPITAPGDELSDSTRLYSLREKLEASSVNENPTRFDGKTDFHDSRTLSVVSSATDNASEHESPQQTFSVLKQVMPEVTERLADSRSNSDASE